MVMGLYRSSAFRETTIPRMVTGMRGEHPIDFRSLQIFGAVCESASLTGAARRLGMTQPAVSQHIRALERHIGVELIDRRTRPVALTAAGTLLRDHGQVLLTDLARLPNLLRQSAQASLPRLRLGFVNSFAAAFGADLIRTMRDRAAHLTLWSGLSPLQHDALMARELDVVVATDALDDLDDPDDLECHPLVREPYILIAPRFLIRDGEEVQLARLAEVAPLIRYSARSAIGRQIDRHLRRLNLDIPRRFEFDETNSLISLVAAGIGWAITTPLCLYKCGYRAEAVRHMPLPGPGIWRTFTLMARRGELADLPRDLATLYRRFLRDQGVPALHRAFEPVGQGIAVIDDPEAGGPEAHCPEADDLRHHNLPRKSRIGGNP